MVVDLAQNSLQKQLEEEQRRSMALEEVIAIMLEAVGGTFLVTKARIEQGFSAGTGIDVSEDLASHGWVWKLVEGE